jgi:antitoxin ParD1/3/4
MNISLTPSLEKFIQEQVDTEQYQTASEVVRAALRELQRRDAAYRAGLEAIGRGLRAAEAQIDRGEYVEIQSPRAMKNFIDDVRRRGRDRLARKPRRRSA